jgi:uncharacterized protein (TIGR02271 family)
MTKPPEQDRRLGVDDSLADPEEAVLLRLEEEADVRPAGWRGVGFLRARKHVEAVPVRETVATDSEELDLEHLPAAEDDPGGVITLPDGAISIPVYEEEVLVTKRVVLKERVVIRKRIETHTQRVEAELRREQIELDVDDGLEDRVRVIDE